VSTTPKKFDHVESAEVIDRAGDGGVEAGAIGHVALHGERLRAGGFNHLHHVGQPNLVARGEHDAGALLSKRDTTCGADSGRAAGDEYGLVFETSGHDAFSLCRRDGGAWNQGA
jgi:hypothetical protein